MSELVDVYCNTEDEDDCKYDYQNFWHINFLRIKDASGLDPNERKGVVTISDQGKMSETFTFDLGFASGETS
jgi:hypothetical protein